MGVICGIAVNDSPVPISRVINGKPKRDRLYQTWVGMIQRCYSKRAQELFPTYKGCSVDPEWHSYMSFKSWAESQDWKGMELDKDILKPGNKVYSKENCAFVPPGVNRLLNGNEKQRSRHGKGVQKLRDGRFASYISENGRQRVLDFHSSAAEARERYKLAKSAIIAETALRQKDGRVKKALLERAVFLIM